MTQDERRVIEMFVALYDASRKYSDAGVPMPKETLDTIADTRAKAISLILDDEMQKQVERVR